MYTIGQSDQTNLKDLVWRLRSEMGLINTYSFRLLYPAISLTASTQLFQSLPPELSKKMGEFEVQSGQLLGELMKAHNIVGFGISEKPPMETSQILHNIYDNLTGWKNRVFDLQREALNIVDGIDSLKRQEGILRVLRNAWKMMDNALEYLRSTVLDRVIGVSIEAIEAVE